MIKGKGWVSETIRREYDSAFYFYFAKPIDSIVRGDQCPQAIQYKDNLYWDQEGEIMRRYYTIPETEVRLKNYIASYEEIYERYPPNLCVVKSFKLLLKRSKRFLNQIRREQEEANLRKEAAKSRRRRAAMDCILPGLMRPNVYLTSRDFTATFDKSLQSSVVAAQVRKDLSENDAMARISFDTTLHDIYRPEFSSKLIQSEESDNSQYERELGLVEFGDEQTSRDEGPSVSSLLQGAFKEQTPSEMYDEYSPMQQLVKSKSNTNLIKATTPGLESRSQMQDTPRRASKPLVGDAQSNQDQPKERLVHLFQKYKSNQQTPPKTGLPDQVLLESELARNSREKFHAIIKKQKEAAMVGSSQNLAKSQQIGSPTSQPRGQPGKRQPNVGGADCSRVRTRSEKRPLLLRLNRVSMGLLSWQSLLPRELQVSSLGLQRGQMMLSGSLTRTRSRLRRRFLARSPAKGKIRRS